MELAFNIAATLTFGLMTVVLAFEIANQVKKRKEITNLTKLNEEYAQHLKEREQQMKRLNAQIAILEAVTEKQENE